MIRARSFRAALLLVALLPVPPAAAQQEEEPPRIFLEKKVFSDTEGGKKRFFETYTVEKGDTLWRILGRQVPLTPDRYAEILKEFRRANPGIVDPSKLAPGQKLLVPSGGEEKPEDDGRTVGYTVKKGDSLSKILSSRGVPARQRKRYLDAVQEINPSVTNVNRIFAGRAIRIPTEGYFTEAKPPVEPERAVAPEEPERVLAAGEPAEPAAPSSPPAPPIAPEPEKSTPPEVAAATPPEVAAAAPPEVRTAAREVPPAPALTRDVAPTSGQDALAPGKPEAELLVPKSVSPAASAAETGKAVHPDEVVVPPSRSPYRGLLSDLFLAIGEKWVDRGTMYLPLPSGRDVVLQLSDFPAVRFSGGTEALIDFRGGIPRRVRDAITEQWKSIRVVSLADAGGAGDRIDRILGVAGYHSVKEGMSQPLVMGETVSVALPARWVIQRTGESLLSGDIVLVKEVPEKPDPGLLAVLRYARRLGIRVLPYADDPVAMEGFLVGVEDEPSAREIPVALAVPKAGGLPAVDFGLALLGIPSKTGERMRIGGEGEAFRLVVTPERLFEAGGVKYVVDTGKISPGIRSILRESGYAVFPVGKAVSGRDILERLMKAAGVGFEERKEYLLSGGANAGYEIRVTGGFLTLPGPPDGQGRKIVLVRRKIHSATRVLLRDMGVEIVEW